MYPCINCGSTHDHHSQVRGCQWMNYQQRTPVISISNTAMNNVMNNGSPSNDRILHGQVRNGSLNDRTNPPMRQGYRSFGQFYLDIANQNMNSIQLTNQLQDGSIDLNHWATKIRQETEALIAKATELQR